MVATGRSDFPNQINNVLAFPGIFRGALDAGARRITPAMKLAAARAIAELAEDDLSADYIVPSPLDPRVAPAVSAAVAAAVGGRSPPIRLTGPTAAPPVGEAPPPSFRRQCPSPGGSAAQAAGLPRAP